MKRAACYFLGISTSLVLILSIFMICLDLNAANYEFYREEYQKLRQSDNIGIGEEDLMKVTRHLVRYMRGQEEDLAVKAKIMGKNREVFSKKDRQHMVDVRNLYVFWLWFSRIGLALFAAVAAMIALMMRREAAKVLARCFLYGTGLFAAIAAVLGTWIAIDFSSFWISFHHVFFTNDLWILDPATSILIQMVPEQFFFDICVRILQSFGLVMLVLILLCCGNIFYRSWKRKELMAVRIQEELASEHMAEEVIEKFVHMTPKPSVSEVITGDPDFYDEEIVAEDIAEDIEDE